MPDTRTATIVNIHDFNPQTRMLTLAMPDGQPLGFVGGRYVIIDPKIVLPSGKVLKRPYSIMSADSRQDRFDLATRLIHSDGVSKYLHDVKAGTEISFEGPWGKFVSASADSDVRKLVVATDTGITSALGLVRGNAFAAGLNKTDLIWFNTDPAYFLPPELVRQSLPAGLASFSIESVDPIGHPTRESAPLAKIRTSLSTHRPSEAYFSGDGAIILPLRDAALESGVAPECVKFECYFNQPAKKMV